MIRQDWDPQPPDGLEPCTVTKRATVFVGDTPTTRVVELHCERAAGEHDLHYTSGHGFWCDPDSEVPF